MKTLLFSFEDLGTKSDKALVKLKQYFSRSGAAVVTAEPGAKTLRSSGISYRELFLTFGDSQRATLRIKQTGDVYQVLINDKLTPMKAQDDHVKAVAEIVSKLDAGRAKFQKALANVKTPMPKGIKTAAPRIEQQLSQREQELDEAIAAANDELQKLQAA
jgi:hypothetical protein